MAKKKRVTSTRKKTGKKVNRRRSDLRRARPYFVHSKALVDKARIGARTRVWAFAHVLSGAEIGTDCNIGECVFVEDGVVLGNHVTVKNGVQLWTGVTCEDYVFIGPNATFTNDVRPRVAHPLAASEFAQTRLGRGASIGANATIVAGVRVGEHAMVGAGSVIIRDVPPYALVVGNPARRIGWACPCGGKLDPTLCCPSCGRAFLRETAGLRPRDPEGSSGKTVGSP